MKYAPIIILCLLCVCFCVPVSATYDLVSQYKYNNGSTTYNANRLTLVNTINNCTNMTKIDAYLTGYYDNNWGSSSATGTWHRDGLSGMQVATGSYSWSTSVHNSYEAPTIVNMTFDNWNIGVYNGSHTLYFKNGSTPFNVPVFNLGSPLIANGYYVNPLVQPRLAGGVYSVYAGTAPPLTANITFHASETGNYTYKLSGVNVSVSSGQYGTTDANGNATITISPPGSSYTFGASKMGYTPITSSAIGSIGSTGGDVYFSMTPAALTTNLSFWVHIYDPLKSAKIADSSLRVTNASYPEYYTTHSSTSGSYLITKTSGIDTISPGQSVNLTGSATGYETANQTVTVPYDGWEYILNLVATSDVPTGANATLVVNCINSYTAEGIEGATITISNNTIPYSSSRLSNAGGSATFSSIPAGRYQISASKTGYQSSTTTWGATASTVTTAYIGLLPVGATPVVTGTAGNPLFDADGNPIVGYDANGNPITAAPTQDTRTDEEKDKDMADFLRDNGLSLIELFVLFTIIYMIKGIGK